MQDLHKMKDTAGDLSDGRGAGIDNLLYSADAEFSCFADLALVSPGEYYKPGEGSLMQVTNLKLHLDISPARTHARVSPKEQLKPFVFYSIPFRDISGKQRGLAIPYV